MAPPPKRPSKSQVDSIIAIGDVVTATSYKDRTKQRSFLDEKTVALACLYALASSLADHFSKESFIPFVAHIASDKSLYDGHYTVKNNYHQTALGANGVIGGRYPTILDLTSQIKVERERQKGQALLGQQVHRSELDEARALAAESHSAEVLATKEAAVASKKSGKGKGKKKPKSKATVDDADDEASVFDDADFPLEGSDVYERTLLAIDELRFIFSAFQIGEPTNDAPGHRATQSLDERERVLVSLPLETFRTLDQFARLIDNNRLEIGLAAMAILARTDPAIESAATTEDLPRPSSRKRARQQASLAHEDAEEQFVGAELAVNNETVQKTVAAARKVVESDSYPPTIGSLRLEESDVRSRIAFTNAQLRYQLDHRDYLLVDLRRILDAQHQRSESSVGEKSS
ncbi:hypothetical protein B0H13DRAFT_2344813 [Mycena leptocephala]|nr:hypothetical protein B0H13DRAFT_2344813 [Mycena leptocephala]